MEARSIIAALRDGDGLPSAAAQWFAAGLASGDVSDAQAGAFAMAILLRGLSEADRVGLTLAMRDSGQVLAWDMPGPVIDKHSTGGIGDVTSLLIAPALAVCGGYVPMISGRGLGHTGGTLDKLESIPGYRCDQSVEDLRQILRQSGCAIVGASAEIAPADRRLYAVRDVTGTVESIDLITASILSKKLAAGPAALVLDVKVGSGAFMKRMDAAKGLAEALVRTANDAGCRTAALISDMSQPLATAAGNALEVARVMELLTEGRQAGPRLWDLSVALGAEGLVLAGLAPDSTEGARQMTSALLSGAAAERFGQMVAAQGGPADFVERFADYLPKAPVQRPVTAGKAGFVHAIEAEALGHAVVGLGGGRLRGGDKLDLSVGLSDLLPVGAEVGPKDVLALVHAANAAGAEEAVARVRAAYAIGAERPADPPLIAGRVG
ncbi:MAG: thymidine phosphorylase [Paracoccaceae bacterium]